MEMLLAILRDVRDPRDMNAAHSGDDDHSFRRMATTC
jgi:hypothetical protein